MAELETLQVNGVDYPLTIHYERRRTMTAAIRKSGIVFRLPSSLRPAERITQEQKLKEWATKRLLVRPHRVFFTSYKHGDIVTIANEQYLLQLSLAAVQMSSAKVEGSTVLITLSSSLTLQEQQKHIATLLSRVFGKLKLPWLQQRIHDLNQKHFNGPVKRISFRNSWSRWGSCSRNGSITISTRLLFVPDDVFEYVCIHELAHLLEMNHSKQFWNLIEQAMPDYREKERWLKEHGGNCGF